MNHPSVNFQKDFESVRCLGSVPTKLSRYVRKHRLSVCSSSSQVTLNQRDFLSDPCLFLEVSCLHLGC